MNVIILAAGFTPSGDEYPLSLFEIDGKPLIQKVIENCTTLKPKNILVTLRADEVRRFHLDNIVSLLAPNTKIIQIQEKTQGAACSALLAIGDINAGEELLIINLNDLIDADLQPVLADFKARKLDAGTVVFPSVHPRYSYVKVNDEGLVIEAAEKNPISRHATVGLFWFQHGHDFVRASMNMIRKDAHVNGAFYICPALNELILLQKKVGMFPIEAHKYHPLKNERQIDTYEASLERGIQ